MARTATTISWAGCGHGCGCIDITHSILRPETGNVDRSTILPSRAPTRSTGRTRPWRVRRVAELTSRIVEGSGLRAAADADQRRGVKHPLQSPVVALGAMQVAHHPPGVTGDWGHTGQAGQAIRRAEGGHVAPGGSQKLRAEQDTDTGQAADHLGGRVAAKPALDELVDLFDLLVEGQHPLR